MKLINKSKVYQVTEPKLSRLFFALVLFILVFPMGIFTSIQCILLLQWLNISLLINPYIFTVMMMPFFLVTNMLEERIMLPLIYPDITIIHNPVLPISTIFYCALVIPIWSIDSDEVTLLLELML